MINSNIREVGEEQEIVFSSSNDISEYGIKLVSKCDEAWA